MSFTLLVIQLLSVLSLPSFRHIGTDEGLSQMSVQTIDEDTNGFIWIGTGDGLNKFEGNKVTVYRHAYRDTTSIADDQVNDVECTVDGSVLVATPNGISCYLPETDNFRTIKGSDRKHIYRCFDLRKCPSLIQDSSKWLLFSTRDMLAVMDTKTGNIDTLSTDIQPCHFLVRDSSLYILSNRSCIYKVKDSFENLQCIFSPPFKCSASCMNMDNAGNIWIANNNNGVISFCPQDRRYRHYTVNEGLSSNMVRALEIDEDGIIWIATGNCLNLLDPKDNSITICPHNNLQPESLSSVSLKAMLKSRSGSMWIGTYYKGIDYFNPKLISFHNTVLPESYWNNSEAIICAISADPEDFLWIGTSRSGIFKYYPQTSKFIPFRKHAIREQSLNAVAYHNRGNLVLFGCSYSGLSIYDKRTDSIVWESNGGSVFSIAEYIDDTYLVGHQHGIKIFDFKDMTMKKVSIPNEDRSRVYYLFTDSEGMVWVGSEHKLYCGELTRDAAGEYEFKIKENFYDIRQVQDIIETDKRLWFASRSGLLCRNKSTLEWSVISDKDGISTNLIRGLEFDKNGYIWASTDRSILLVDPETLSFQEYHTKDGLVNEKYNIYANSKTSDGTIWFGGTSGITHFKPQIRHLHNTPQPPFISDLHVNGERLLSGTSEALSKPIYASEELNLKADQNNISLTLSNHDIFSKDRIEYKMGGIDKNWQSLSPKSNTVSYTNLPAGDNEFRVRSVNILTGAKSDTCSIVIHVKCHWYQSIGFIVTICVLIILSIFLFISYIKSRSSSKIEEILSKAKMDIQTAKTSSYLTMQSMNRKRDIDFISRALEVVQENISNDKFNIDQFAAKMNMSRSNLHIRIKSAYGFSAVHFIRRIRIEKAMEYLQDDKMNISEIAYSVGFSSATYFATAFKQVTGVNPTEWRQSTHQDTSKDK